MIADYRPSLLQRLGEQRRQIGSSSPEAFARIYLAHHFTRPPSHMHRELFGILAGATQNRPRRIAVAAPRGHAKTTVVSLAYVLWSILYRTETLVLLVSATRELAATFLKDLRKELETNSLLLEDFPDACVPPERRRTVKPWKDTQLTLPTGIAVRALGGGQRMRGIKHHQHRPSLIVVDDLEDQEQTGSGEQREKLRDWFERTLLKTVEPGSNVIVVGTILHYASLLAQLTGSHPGVGQPQVSGWESRIYRAVESFSERPDLWDRWEAIYSGAREYLERTGPAAASEYLSANRAEMLRATSVLWPEMESYEKLMEIRIREGRHSFNAEKQNEPLDPTQCLFREDRFRFWDDQFPDAATLLAAMGSYPRIYGACDPSMGRHGGRGDYSAIVTLVEDPKTKILCVLEADLAIRSPTQIIERILAFARLYRYRDFGVESNSFQELLVTQLDNAARAAGLYLPVKKIQHSSDKNGRIQSLEPLLNSGKLRLSRHQMMLRDQLRQFPLGAHDDGPDALEMAVSLAMNGGYGMAWINLPR